MGGRISYLGAAGTDHFAASVPLLRRQHDGHMGQG